NRATHCCTASKHGVLHSRHAKANAIRGRAVPLGRSSEPRHRLAYELVTGRFEGRIVRNRKFAGCSCECAITQLAARRRVNDETVIGFAAFSGHVSLLVGGSEQNLPCSSASFPAGGLAG